MDFLRKALAVALMLLTINQSQAMPSKFSRVGAAFRPFGGQVLAGKSFSPFRFNSRSFRSSVFARSMGTMAPARSFSKPAFARMGLFGGLTASVFATHVGRAEGVSDPFARALEVARLLDERNQAIENGLMKLEASFDVEKENESLKAKLAKSEAAKKKLEDEKAQCADKKKEIEKKLNDLRNNLEKCNDNAYTAYIKGPHSLVRSYRFQKNRIYAEAKIECYKSFNNQTSDLLKELMNLK
jgi:hypothetical protein